MKKVWLLNCITFISAFLLFQIELIIAKMLLPNYGGSYLVWGSCIVFFQAVLLTGYLFSHYTVGQFGIKRYRLVHLILLFLPLIFFPGKSLDIGEASSSTLLNVDVFIRLCMTIGPVFFVLSTISLFTQSYLSKSNLPSRNNPYPLYAVSNIGSFAGLLSYPFVFEPLFTLSQQLIIWRFSYFLLIILHGAAYFLIGVNNECTSQTDAPTDEDRLDFRRWLMLGAAGTSMFLSVNNIITIESAPVPLLWILPLGIYLLSFVFNFKKTTWCPGWMISNVHIVLGFSMLLYFLIQKRLLPFVISTLFLCTALFVLCMYCQNQLIRSRPKNDSNLTYLYVAISLGSFLGGLITSWIIPLISTSLVEYLFGLTMVAMCISSSVPKEESKRSFWLVIFYVLFFIFWQVCFVKYHFWGLLGIIYMTKLIYGKLANNRTALVGCFILIYVTMPLSEILWANDYSQHKIRNYYGIYKITDYKSTRRLYNGMTLHGSQTFRKGKKPVPTTYYGYESPVGKILTSKWLKFKRIGVVGLGIGTLAAYTNKDQILDFYELDPEIYKIADNFFTYTRSASGQINYFYGDARSSLAKNENSKYDLLVIDAFGGDAIPTHLLTTEVMNLYRNRMTDDGILMFHISSQYVDLKPVLARNAMMLNADVCFLKNDKVTRHDLSSVWVAITWDKDRFKRLVSDFNWKPFDHKKIVKYRPWSDEYSNMLPVIRLEGVVKPLKLFRPFYW